MNTEDLFRLCNLAVLPAWLLLAAAPRWKWTARFVAAWLMPFILALVYSIIIATGLFAPDPGAGAGGSFGSLAGIRALFQDDRALLAGWIHYLTFDLFVGSWEVRDAHRLGIPHLWILPCLFFTLMLGPFGLLLYLILRGLLRRSVMVE